MASTNFKWGVNYLSWPNGWPIVNGTNSTQPLGYCTLSSTTSRAQTSTLPTVKAQTATAITSGQQRSTLPSSGYQLSTASTAKTNTPTISVYGDRTSAVPTGSAQQSTTALSEHYISTGTTTKAQVSVTMSDGPSPAPTGTAQTSASPQFAPSSVDTVSVTAFPPPPDGVCSITSVIYMFTSTIWVHPGGNYIPPLGYGPDGGDDGKGGFGDGPFGCVPVTRTVHV